MLPKKRRHELEKVPDSFFPGPVLDGIDLRPARDALVLYYDLARN